MAQGSLFALTAGKAARKRGTAVLPHVFRKLASRPAAGAQAPALVSDRSGTAFSSDGKYSKQEGYYINHAGPNETGHK